MKRLQILEGPAGLLFHAVLVASLYFVFVGHNQPGGGFVGGLVAGAAISLRYLLGGIDDVRRISRFRPWTILAAGLLTSAVTAFVPLLVGEPVLTSLATTLDVTLLGLGDVIGDVYVSTTLLFDLGVYVLVVGLVFMVFEAFGEDQDHLEHVEHTEPSS